MKKVLVSTFVIIAFVLYGVLHSNTERATIPTTSSSNSPTTSNSSTYKDGKYTGSAADAVYGEIQVQATISDGKITNVQFLQYPNEQGHSIELNQQADPTLAQEAIQEQSANVDIVSGATDTSEAFIESLTSVLDQAKA